MGRPNGFTILVVDDEPGIRNFLAALLGAAGYSVLTACDGPEALRRCRERDRRFDLVLTDIVMPEMSGPELARRLLEIHPGTRILFMTGYADAPHQEDLRSCVRMPAAPVLLKPFRPAELLERVRSALDSSGSS